MALPTNPLPGRFPTPSLAAAMIALGAVAWGGATARIPQAAVLGVVGVLLALAPSRRYPDRGFAWPTLGLLLLSSCAWWPWPWFSASPWRMKAQAAGIVLPGTLSPQPALSIEGLVLLAAGLAWAGWLGTQPWEARSRRAAAQTLAGGFILLAAAALIAWELRLPIPGWLDERGFGPFPNRNHTGYVLALGGVLTLGCAGDARRRSVAQCLPWLAGTALLLAALAVNNSRGGVLLFFGAVSLWLAFAACQRASWKLLALGASALLVVSAVLLVAGGPIAARFAGGADSQIAFRKLIWQDTLALVHASPWCGVGLENFRALFPFFRTASVIQQQVLHPESDWLLLAAEMGWFAVVLVAVALAVWIRKALPLAKGTQRQLRGAALAGAVAAAAHGLIDVPAHRLGSALVALFVLALAQRDALQAPESRGAAAFWRLLGLALIASSIWWMNTPDDAARAEALSQAGHFAEAESAATRALERAPLDWAAYFTRAGARACAGRPLEALADFRRARFLEPHYAGVPLEEGRFWARRAPELALPAWRETLRRVAPPEDEAIFGAILAAAPDDAGFRSRLLALAKGRPALQLIWFQAAPPAEAKAHLAELSASIELWDQRQRAAFQRRAVEIEGAAPRIPTDQ